MLFRLTDSKNETNRLLALIRAGRPMTTGQQLRLTAYLSAPAIVAQLSSIAMQYIDASMVGRLGAHASAAIGLVATTTWLFGGLLSAVATGFSVQVAHLIGADRFDGARRVVKESMTVCLLFALALGLLGALISSRLPAWLGGDPSIHADSGAYFLLYSLFLPALQLNFLFGGMLRCSGNMFVPGLMGVAMCGLDVVLNLLFIFGLDMGVVGAALGTVCAELITALLLGLYLWHRSPTLRLRGGEGSFLPRWSTVRRAVGIGLPMGFEHAAICGAQILTTVIVAPLGIVAIAANSFAIIAESLCYMPGYGIAEAATTLVGQSLGAGRRDLMHRFARITVCSGMAIMGLMGLLMYVFAPEIIGLMTPVEDIRLLGVEILRIEAFAEPMFAASIVAYGVFVGAGSTFIPSLMNFGSIWGIRLTLAFLLAPTCGLRGVWIAMCVELCFRGLVFLLRLRFGGWARRPVPAH